VKTKLKLAFTLIELLVVIAIIGILSGLIIVTMNGMTNGANIAKAQVFSNSLRNSLLMSIVSEWKFDEINTSTTTTTPDSWSSGNIGTLKQNGYAGVCDSTHCPQLQETDCVFEKCLFFDGSNDYVNVGTMGDWGSTRNNNFTLSTWVKLNANNSIMTIMGCGDSTNGRNSLTLRINTRATLTLLAGSVRIGLASDESTLKVLTGATNANNVPVGLWTYIVATVVPSANNIVIYINGIPKSITYGTQTTPAIFANFSNFFALGSNNSPIGTEEYFNGSIDDVRIFNSAIPSSQVRQNYYSGLNSLLASGQIDRGEYEKRALDLNNEYAKK
jgi:prepilin-type N-terminal cleavage/methylation domain-containing protein